MASMLRAAALSGTRIERKAIISRTSEMPITTAKKIGIRSTWRAVASSAIAVEPVICSRVPGAAPRSAAGACSLRSERTSSCVSSCCGGETGTIVKTAASPAALRRAGATAAACLAPASSCCARARNAWSSGPAGDEATAIRAALTPGP